MLSELQMRILQELSKSDEWVEEAELDILKAHYREPYAIVDALSSLYKEELIDILPRLSAKGGERQHGQPMETIQPDSYKITEKGRLVLNRK